MWKKGYSSCAYKRNLMQVESFSDSDFATHLLSLVRWEQAASFLDFEPDLEVPRSCLQNCIGVAKLHLFQA